VQRSVNFLHEAVEMVRRLRATGAQLKKLSIRKLFPRRRRPTDKYPAPRAFGPAAGSARLQAARADQVLIKPLEMLQHAVLRGIEIEAVGLA